MTGIERGAISLIHPLRDSARVICERYGGLLPDLSSLRVVVPTRHVYPAFATELGRASKHSSLLLPQISSFADWAAATPLSVNAVSDSFRELQLYDALRERPWLDGVGDLWSLVTELRGLSDELSRHNIGLPKDASDWLRQLELAYQAKAGEFLKFEARLVFEAWRALTDDKSLDAVARYHSQLRAIAQGATDPLVVIGIGDLTPAESEFLERYATRQNVLSLSTAPDQQAHTQFLVEAWARLEERKVSLIQRARAYATRVPESPVSERITFYAARGLEDEARAADVKVRTWLLEGKTSIAVVIQDRLVARRLRALLERADVLVQDETGWTLSTVAAATVVMRLLDCIANDFYFRDALDLLKSPFVFADVEPNSRKANAEVLERAIRKRNFSGGFEALRALANSDIEDPEPRRIIDRLAAARNALSHSRGSVGEWLARLHTALDALGVLPRLLEDAAGQQVLELLARLSNEVGGVRYGLSFGDWRRWLDMQFERENFRDRDVMSNVLFTHLAATQLRAFDGVILLGAGAKQLPSPRTPGPFLNDAVRGELGLPTTANAHQEQQDQLLGLFTRATSTLVTWQADVEGEENLLSPWLELLQVFHEASFGKPLPSERLRAQHEEYEVRAPAFTAPMPQPAGAPAPSAPALVPLEVSVSAYRNLVDCPYQFFARHLLRLNPIDEVRETMEKRDYGIIAHRVLHEFHRRHPQIAGIAREQLLSDLLEISERAFAKEIKNNYQAFIEWVEWRTVAPQYIEWQCAREAEGWRFAEGEVDSRRALWDAQDAVTLHGRLDRIDRKIDVNGEIEIAILDYKTKRPDRLKQELSVPGEEVQLSAYSVLRPEASVTQYVALNKEKVKCIGPEGDAMPHPNIERERGKSMFKSLRAGAPLTAQGDQGVCEHCEASGLCRRKYWP